MTVEKRLEKKLREEVKKLGGVALKFWCMSFTGFPDRMVLMPDSRIWFVELKSTGEKLKRRQPFVKRLLERLGFEVLVLDTEILLNEFLKRIQE